MNLTTLALVAGSMFTVLGAYIGLSIAPLQKDIEQNRSDIKDLRQMYSENVVPRREHEKDWLAESQREASLQKQIDDLGKELGSAYSLHDQLTDMSDRLKRLEEEHPPRNEGK